VRPHPVTEGRYQIVYGRRRVLALRDLGQPVKALIRDLDDRELLLAQGQENTARRDLSFIEKVNFARQMEEAGYDRKVICDAISVDKTLISRMLSIAGKIAPEVIEAIGAAPSVGRDRWQSLADLIETADTDIDTMVAMLNLTARSPRSDDRFQALLNYLSSSAEKAKAARRGPPKDPVAVRAEDGLPLGRATYDSRFLTLKLRLSQTEGFEAWLLDHLPALHRDWRSRQS
jgi:ParB family chromosome partitioning protein